MAKKEEWTYWQIVSQGMEVEDRRLRMFVRHKASLGVGREHILRKLLTEQTPEPYRVNTGFVIHPASSRVTSGQCDVLVYDPRVSQPLYRIDEFAVVSADAARIAIEVRSKMSLGDDSGLEQVTRIHRSMRPAFPTQVFGFGFRGPTFENFVAGVATVVKGDILNVPECVAVHKQNYICIRSTRRAAMPENATAPRVPGWIWKHTAELFADGTITVRGGEVVEDRDGKRHFRRNLEDFALDLATGVWRRVTERHWGQWRVRRADGKRFEIEPLLRPEGLVPLSIPTEVLPCEEEWNRARVAVEGVPVELTVGHREVEVVVEGWLPEALARRVVEEVRSRTEAATGQLCVLEPV